MNKSSSHITRKPGRLAVLVLVFALFASSGSVFFPQPVFAASCSTVPGCKAGSTAASKFASTSVSVALTTFRILVQRYVGMIKDAITRTANQTSNNYQDYARNEPTASDKVVNEDQAVSQATARTVATMEMIPSRTACRTASSADRINKAAYSTARLTTYSQSQRVATDYAANAPGGPTERGSIQASQAAFKDMFDGFCDPAVINPPAGVSCTLVNDSSGKPMAFRFSQPYLAVFGVPNGTISPTVTSPDNRAARLFARMAVEPVPPDPIRGAVLTRNEGQAVFVRRQSDIASLNLARGALDHIVDDRIGTSAAGGESLEYLRQRSWSDASGIAKDVIDRAAQPSSANMDDLAPMINENNKVYLQIYDNLMRFSAMYAAYQARRVLEHSAGQVSLASRGVNN